MRNLPEVIDQMLAVIPEGHAIVPVLADIKSSAQFTAPETEVTWWHTVSDTLQEFLGDPTTDEWKQEVAKIFAGENDD